MTWPSAAKWFPFLQAPRTERALVREARQNGASSETLQNLFLTARTQFPSEWLALVEILELAPVSPGGLKENILQELQKLSLQQPQKKEYIDLGIQLADQRI
jgi:hypothetical protein